MSYKVYFVVALISCVLSALLILWFKSLFPDYSYDWLRSIPSATAIYGFIMNRIEKKWWKYKYIKLLLSIDLEDLNWVWKWNLDSSYVDPNWTEFKNLPCELHIKQTLTSITVNWYFDKSASNSQCATIYKQNWQTKLHYNYLNNPAHGSDQDMNMHQGYCTLVYSKSDNSLNWVYSNSKERDRHWTLKVYLQ